MILPLLVPEEQSLCYYYGSLNIAKPSADFTAIIPTISIIKPLYETGGTMGIIAVKSAEGFAMFKEP